MSSNLDIIISFGSLLLTVFVGLGIRIGFRRGRGIGDQ
jgi:hypothetical protein